jgi:hypothetical protein
MDKENALSDLAGEGWTISGSYPKQPPGKQQPKQGFRGYGLMRTMNLLGLRKKVSQLMIRKIYADR